MKNMATWKKALIASACIAFVALAFSGCSVEVGDQTLVGINILFAPFLAIWEWLWDVYTPNFWEIIALVWDMPPQINWLAGPIVYVLGAIFYVAILLIAMVLDIILGLVTGILWFLLAIPGAIF